MKRVDSPNPNIKIEGWNIRDYLAGQIINGIMSSSRVLPPVLLCAYLSYEIADAMLVERSKTYDRTRTERQV